MSIKNEKINYKLKFIECLCLCLIYLNGFTQENISISIPEYNVEINSRIKLGDTIFYNLDDVEDFKFVFYDTRGKCYCERFLKGKLYQRGYYENSLDTLKKYVFSRSHGMKRTKFVVWKYFQPLKNGTWITYGRKGVKNEKYIMGVLNNELE